MTRIVTEALCRTLGSTRAVQDINLDVADGELFFLLGPSGCGKSTLLGLIAGLDQPDSGRVRFDDRDVTRVATEQRGAVMCFQSYALFPHLDVQSNVAFGLQVRRMPAPERQRRVEAVLELVRMSEFKSRKPAELSGGQQQRVALARALAVEPECLLLDEPLSNLDARLRQEMRGEIRRVCKASRHTTLYVTHDQKEALSIADRIAVMNQGRVVQVGTPTELYAAPTSPFVAEFVSGANLLPGEITGQRADLVEVRTAIGTLLAKPRGIDAGHVILSVRPDQLRLGPADSASGHSAAASSHSAADVAAADDGAYNSLVARVKDSGFLGDSSEHTLELQGTQLRATSSPPRFELPAEVGLRIAARDLLMFPAEGS